MEYRKQWTSSRNAVETSVKRSDVGSSSRGTLSYKWQLTAQITVNISAESNLKYRAVTFSNFLYSRGGSHKRLGPEAIYLLLSISTGLGALIYAVINALKKLTPWQL